MDLKQRSSIQQVDPAQVMALYAEQCGQYEQHAALEREVAHRLLERVEFQRREPARIIDLGCGTGYCAAALKRKYRKAEVIGLDFALPMCRLAANKSTFMRPVRVVCANISSLPFANSCADLLVANPSLQWSADLAGLFNGLRRVMRPGGLLLFSLPVTDSLKELKQACESAGLGPGVGTFPDMHDIGDALLLAGFREPVMDAELITLTYPGLAAMLHELQAVGAASYFHDYAALQSRSGEFAAHYPRVQANNSWPLTWEIAYGAAFGPEEGQPVRQGKGEIATFSVEALRGTRRK
ncbi:MAG TPA: methyltransferase domain-containing protein [Xanthomonadales bacterium]|nr:methyltransferase domain-containing protein [Xanthomonadales bacterium]